MALNSAIPPQQHTSPPTSLLSTLWTSDSPDRSPISTHSFRPSLSSSSFFLSASFLNSLHHSLWMFKSLTCLLHSYIYIFTLTPPQAPQLAVPRSSLFSKYKYQMISATFLMSFLSIVCRLSSLLLYFPLLRFLLLHFLLGVFFY